MGTSKLPATEPVRQLALLCACGRRRIELPALGQCRLCYHRNYHSRRCFGGMRESVLKRDRQRCRACGAAERLIVHHRTGRNAKRVLITLCIRCHVRLHRLRTLRHWLPEPLLELWRELNPEAAWQYQLPLGQWLQLTGGSMSGQHDLAGLSSTFSLPR